MGSFIQFSKKVTSVGTEASDIGRWRFGFQPLELMFGHVSNKKLNESKLLWVIGVLVEVGNH